MNTNSIPLLPKTVGKDFKFQAQSIVSQVIFKSKNINITLFAVSKGQEFTPHTTTKQAIVHILEGSGLFMLDKKWFLFKVNDYFFMPKELVHAIKAKSDFKFLLYLIN